METWGFAVEEKDVMEHNVRVGLGFGLGLGSGGEGEFQGDFLLEPWKTPKSCFKIEKRLLVRRSSSE